MNIITDIEDRWLSTKDAAEATGFAQTHFNTLLVKGTIQGEKGENGRWRFRQSELDKYLKSNEVKPRRARKFTETDKDNQPATSLFTQLDEHKKLADEKDQHIEILTGQLNAAKSQHSAKEAKTTNQINDLQSKIKEKTREIEQLREEIAELHEDKRQLLDEIFKHTEFLRNTVKDVIRGFCGIENKPN